LVLGWMALVLGFETWFCWGLRHSIGLYDWIGKSNTYLRIIFKVTYRIQPLSLLHKKGERSLCSSMVAETWRQW
jgi:hypothetical protein